MNDAIKIDKNQYQIVCSILKKHLPPSAVVWVFGSRANQTPKPYSDLDLAIDIGTEMPSTMLIDLKHDFDESLVPYKVDVLDWHGIDVSFQTIVLSTAIRFKCPNV